jgi:hypothetical protein
MKTLHSVAIAGALFAAFLALGTGNSTAGTASPPVHAESDCTRTDAKFVHDKEAIRLFLLYHNPSHGGASAVTPVPGRPIALSI